MPYYEQPGRTTTIDKDGKTIVTVTYVGDQEATLASDVTGTVKNKSVTKDVAGQVRTQFQVEADVQGNDAGRAGQWAGGVVVEIVSAVRTVPIEAHPNFGGSQISTDGFIKKEGLKIIKDAILTVGKKFSDIEDQVRETGSDVSKSRSLYGYLASGIESYYVPSLVVRKTYQAGSPPSATGRVGKIANPSVSVPGLPKNATFLLINITARGSSGSFTVTEEYEMSGEGGWDTFLYG